MNNAIQLVNKRSFNQGNKTANSHNVASCFESHIALKICFLAVTELVNIYLKYKCIPHMHRFF